MSSFFRLVSTISIIGLFTIVMWGQTNPAAQALPYTQTWGTSQFTTMPVGTIAWTVTTQSTQAGAEASAASGDRAMGTSKTASTTTAGIYSYLPSGTNVRLYNQATTAGTYQFATAINTGSYTGFDIAYTIEAVNVGTGRSMGVVLQYRLGTSGAWTTVAGSPVTYSNVSTNKGTSDVAGNIDSYSFSVTGLTASTVYQIRWATWYLGSTGNTPGVAFDNIGITGTGGGSGVITADITGFTGAFGNAAVGSSSASSSFTVSGTSLTNDIVVTPPTGFEIKTGAGTFSTSPITLPQSGGVVGATTIDVRFAPLTAAAFSANITCVSTGATSQNVAVSGNSMGSITTSVVGFTGAFGNALVGTSTSSSSFTVSGSNLTNNITVTPPTGFEIRTGSDAFSTTPITLTQTGGVVNTTTIDARFTPLTAAAFSANIVCASTGATSQNVAVSGNSVGTITLTTSSFVGAFGYVAFGNSSASSSFTVEGLNLSFDLVVTPPAGFEIRTGSNAFSTSAVTLTPVSGAVSATTIDARYTPLAVASYSGNIACTSTGATTRNAAVSGNSLISSVSSGNWNSTSTWNTGEVPITTDNIIISSGHTVTVDDATAVCQNITFGDATAHIAMGSASSVLSLYGNLTAFSTAHAPFSAWPAGAKLKFTGSAAVQTISGFATSGTTNGLNEVIVDKSGGKVTTQGNDMNLGLGTSLDVVNGIFEIASSDDIYGQDNAAAQTTPTITIRSGATFRIVAGTTQVNMGSSATGYRPIGKMTIYGTAELVCASSNKMAIGGIDVESGGILRLIAGWSNTTANEFCSGVITVKSGATFENDNNATLTIWSVLAGAASLVLESGSTAILNSTSNTFALPLPASLTDNGCSFKYALAGAQTGLYSKTYTNLEISGGASKTLGGNITVNGTLSLNEGLLVLGANNLTLGASAVVSGTPSATNMIVTSGAGNVIKSIADAQSLPYSFTFPIGETTGTTEYSPVTVTLNSGTLASASINAKVVNAKHASNTSVADYLDRYWTLASVGITGGSMSLNGTYLPADVVGTESNMISANYSSGSWTNYSLANSSAHTLSASGIIALGDFSAVTAPASGTVVITMIPEGYYRSDVDPLPVSDTFTATLASATGPDYADVETVNVKIDSVSYTGTATFTTATTGSYYLYVKGLALMSTWSAVPITFTQGSSVSYDFTDAVTKAYAIPGFPFDPMILQGTKWCIYGGDVDQDELIGNVDLTMIDNDAFVTLEVHGATDLDGDALVGNVDLTICDNHAFWVVESQSPRKVSGMASKYLHKPVPTRKITEAK